MNFSIRQENTETLVIGNGLSGLCSGISAKNRGLNTLIVSKCYAMRSHSTAAAGGVNATFSKNDSELHFNDTFKSADGLGKEDSIRLLCENSKRAIEAFEEAGTLFSRNFEGKLNVRAFGGQGEKRTHFVKDRTGLALMQTALEQAEKSGVKFLDNIIIFQLLFSNKKNCCYGALGVDVNDFSLVSIFAENTIIATGGAAAIYKTTSNGYHSTGDGLSLILDCGLPLLDIEMIQFHPTGLYPSGILISEAARGEGAILLNSLGERFMFNYDKNGELAKRDVVSKAILEEIKAGRGCGDSKDFVLLDCRDVKNSDRLPEISELAKDFQNCDISKSPIKVRPTAHYIMGGIYTDINCRVLDKDSNKIMGLFATGECANFGIHGANRLGGNSLLETIIFGFIAGKSSSSFIGTKISEQDKNRILSDISKELFDNKNEILNTNILKIKEELKNIMDEKVGIIKNETDLEIARKKIEKLKKEISSISVATLIKNRNNFLQDFLEIKSSLNVASAIVEASITRDESRGAFLREDKKSRAKEVFHTLTYFEEDKTLSEKHYD